MRMKKFRNSDDAVVGIVVTVLLIGLVLAVMVMIRTVYLPQWSEDKEAVHMEEISNQFARLKYALDIQSVVNHSTAISTSVTLGSKEIPFFNFGRSFDSLEITEDSCKIIINSTTDSSTYITDTIKFSSGNSYFVDQSYIYEAGALILSQYPTNVLLGKPSFFVTTYGKNLTFTITNLSGIAGNAYVSGYGIYPIYTELVTPNNQYSEINNVTNITIITNFTNAWYTAINSSLLNSGFVFGGDGVSEIGYNLISATDRIILEFIDSNGEYVNLFLRVVNISAQLAFGLIE